MLYKFRDTTPINTDPVTVTGEIVTVDASDEITDLVGVIASIEPIQSGSGTPSPDNVRPISGHTEVVTQRTGKNLFNEQYPNIDGSMRRVYVQTGNGTFTLSTTTQAVDGSANLFFQAGQATSGESTGGNGVYSGRPRTVTTTDGYVTISYRLVNNTTDAGNPTKCKTQLENGSTPTTYEPYNGNTYTTDLGRTVYGGTLDVVSGELVVDRAKSTLDQTYTWSVENGGMRIKTSGLASVIKHNGANNTLVGAICDKFEERTPNQTWAGGASGIGFSVAPNGDVAFCQTGEKNMGYSDWITFVTNNPIELCYELATPQTYQLTPQEVELLLGTNNLWTDCGEISVTTKKTLDRIWLPSEAVSINGQYLENVVDGYRTLYTKGRESLEVELDTYSVGTADGETYKSKRYPARTIKVGFQLIAPDNYEFRRRFNQLNNLLSLDEADFIFNDETDKFFAGIPRFNAEVDAGENSVKGEWEIYCAYPFKRTVEPVTLTMSDAEVTDTSATFTINYKGGQPAYPVLKAIFAGAKSGGSSSEDGDCGFVAFLDEDENIIQLGNPDVIDRDQYASAVTLINKEFVNTTGWTGSATIRNITDTYWQRGKGQTQSYASMGNLSQTTEGAVDLKIGLVHRLCINNAGQTGTFGVSAKDANGNIVCGFVIRKTGNGTTARVEYILGGAVRGADNIDISYYNTHFGYCNRTPVYVKETYTVPTTQTTKVMVKVGKKKKKKKKYKTISKTVWVKKVRTVQKGWNFTQSNLNSMFVKDADKVTFNVGNLPARTFKLADIAQTVSTTIQIYGTGNFHTNAVHSAIFRRETGAVFAEQPNVFTAGDVVEADCNDATVQIYRDGSVGGSLEPQYGALGNDWEGFKLHNGYNVIRAVWSDWVNPTYKPSIEIEYNEVFI